MRPSPVTPAWQKLWDRLLSEPANPTAENGNAVCDQQTAAEAMNGGEQGHAQPPSV